MTFREFAANRTVIFDGAMGTTIQALGLDAALWGAYAGNNEYLCLSAPDVITGIHRKYFEAGADVAVTNTFGATVPVLAEYGLGDKDAEINQKAVECAKKAAEGLDNKFVALSVGPGTKLPTLSQISYEELFAAYCRQIEAGIKAGADLILIETCQDLLQMKAAINAAADANTVLETDVPVSLSFTIEKSGKLLVGTDIATVAAVLSGYNIFSLGLNCGFGPEGMSEPLTELASAWNGRLYLSANAGMPILENGQTRYPMNAEDFGVETTCLLESHGLAMVGGCCGTATDHIEALAILVGERPAPVRASVDAPKGFAASAYSITSLEQSPAPTFVGERANATGSKAFRLKLQAEDWDGVAAIAQEQEEAAHIIDISVAVSGRDEKADMLRILPMLNSQLKQPLMIDSTSVDVIASALECISGKAVINSVNLEDGGAKMRDVCALVKRFPSAAVALTIDEEGMAMTVERKLDIARRIVRIWHEEYSLPKEDLLMDFLTFSVATGDEDAKIAAQNTLTAMKLFKQEEPQVKSILGVSNVSFGLSGAERTVLNSVFLNCAVNAGLTAAIVHASKILPLSSVESVELSLANALINGEEGSLDDYMHHFEHKAAPSALPEENESLAPEEELSKKILKGDSGGLETLIETVLKSSSPKDILNNILLPAMAEVGKQFGSGKLLLPFVLKSAEAMRKAGDILSPLLKSGETVKRGKIVLATVKGDVHDIGKNLVDIILSGNGYEVVNIGTKVSGADIVKAAKEACADAVGMSGLLVKSVEIMKENIKLIKDAGLDVKVLLGGAALSPDYVEAECKPIMPGQVYYCEDAFAGLNALQEGEAQTEIQKAENTLEAEMDMKAKKTKEKAPETKVETAAKSEKKAQAKAPAVAETAQKGYAGLTNDAHYISTPPRKEPRPVWVMDPRTAKALHPSREGLPVRTPPARKPAAEAPKAPAEQPKAKEQAKPAAEQKVAAEPKAAEPAPSVRRYTPLPQTAEEMQAKIAKAEKEAQELKNKQQPAAAKSVPAKEPTPPALQKLEDDKKTPAAETAAVSPVRRYTPLPQAGEAQKPVTKPAPEPTEAGTKQAEAQSPVGAMAKKPEQTAVSDKDTAPVKAAPVATPVKTEAKQAAVKSPPVGAMARKPEQAAEPAVTHVNAGKTGLSAAEETQISALHAVKSVPTMAVPKRSVGVIDPKAARIAQQSEAATISADSTTLPPSQPLPEPETPVAESAPKEQVKVPSAVITKDLQQLHDDNPVITVPETDLKEPWNVKTYEGTVHSSFVGVTPPLYVAIDELVPLIKKISLFEGRWGYRPGIPEWENREKELEQRIAAIKKDSGIRPQIIFGYYPIRVENEKIWINAGDGFRLFSAFPENDKGECFADLFKTTADHSIMPMQVVTLGAKAQEYVEEFFVSGKYGDYYSTHGLLSELTEALSLYTSQIVAQGLTFMGRAPKFLRFSFGYPRLPDLAGNRQLLALLMSEQMGVSATDYDQMFPLYTTSAIVSWHPDGKY